MSLEAAIEFIIERKEQRNSNFTIVEDLWVDLIEDIKARLVEDADDLKEITYYNSVITNPRYSEFKKEFLDNVYDALGPNPWNKSDTLAYIEMNSAFKDKTLALVRSQVSQREEAHENFMERATDRIKALSEYLFKLKKAGTEDILFFISLRDDFDKVELNNYGPLVDMLNRIAVYKNKN